MCGTRLYSEKYLSVLYRNIHYGVERTHKSAIELVKNNLLFFNIFIDMLHNKIQVLINTLVQEKFMSNNSKRMNSSCSNTLIKSKTLEKQNSFKDRLNHPLWVWDQVIQVARVFSTQENEGSFPNTVNIQTLGKRYNPYAVYICQRSLGFRSHPL